MKINKIFFAMLFGLLVVSSPIVANLGQANKGDVLTCAGYSVEVKGNSAGLIQTLDNLNITAPQIIGADIFNGCAVVVWNTQYLSTSQVIFKKLGENNKVDLIDGDENNYWGYTYGSLQNNAPQKYHIMIVNGLEKDVFYVMRAVSRAHPSALPYISQKITVLFTDVQLSDSKKVDDAKQDTSVATEQTNNAFSSKKSNENVKSYDVEKFPVVKIEENTETVSSIDKGELSDQNDNEMDINIVQNEKREIIPSADDKLVSAIGAANAADSLKPLWMRLKNKWNQWFVKEVKSTSTDEMAGVRVNATTEEKKDVTKAKIYGAKNAQDILFTIILPTILILITLFIAQKLAEKYADFISDKKLLFWMLGFIVAGILFAVFKMISLALIFVALFLLSLAWYLFDSAVNDMTQEDERKDIHIETLENDQ